MRTNVRATVFAIAAAMIMPAALWGQAWEVVVNNGVIVPGDASARKFNSYNPPSLNLSELVVFRARSKGGMMGQGGEPAHGVYVRDMNAQQFEIGVVFDRNAQVPYPNNLGSTFIEPPAFPRIDIWGDTVASRAVHKPVWKYQLSDDEETRAGTTGIYVRCEEDLITGVSNLGAAPGFEFLSVPGHPGIKFDVFPGAPAVIGNTVVFKGNYVFDSNSYTGVYYRDLSCTDVGGDASIVLIANSENTLIPGTEGVKFGSTAPPSAAVAIGTNSVEPLAVFAGFDNEENPTAGGIYLAVIGESEPPLMPLVEIGSQVPGAEHGTVFNRLGEGLSFDGRFVAFWGAWGSATKTITLRCPADGNKELIEYCLEQHPNGFEVAVPLYQGIFVHDIVTGRTRAVAKSPDDFDDFVYWNFSGRVPETGEGDDDGELARWRSAAFVAVSGLADLRHSDSNYHVAFKARTGIVDEGTYIEPLDGIYLRKGPRQDQRIETLAETGMDGAVFDPDASGLPVTEMSIERDSFRGDSIAIAVTMATEEEGWAGIYLTRVNDRNRDKSKE